MGNAIEKSKVWYVTGASKGLGLALVKKLLATGYRVAATSRNIEALISAVEVNTDHFLPLKVDLTNRSSVLNSVDEVVKQFGSINVVVNNAGYGMAGTIEEFSEEELKQSFEVNVFGPAYVMQAALPHMRERKTGHIINISSIAGLAAVSGWAVYAGTKSALTAMTDVLAQDLEEFGINATAVAPGGFRTDFLKDSSMVFTARKIDDYSSVRNSHARYKSMDGLQAGDPDKAATAIIGLAEMANPPRQLFLGTDAFKRAKTKLEELDQMMEMHRAISFSTDF